MATSEPTDRTTTMTASSAQPWRALPAIRPKVFVRANGMIRMSSISTQFVIVVGFSNGWAELALKKPPPLLPSSLIASCEATGPSGIVWTAPWRVWTVDRARRRSGSRPGRRGRARRRPRSAAGCRGCCGSGRPRSCRWSATDLRTRPRVRAMATAMPVAAEMKLRTASPAIWVRYVIVVLARSSSASSCSCRS